MNTDKIVHEGSPYVSIQVLDSGVGIPRDKMDLIFEPFYTTKVAEKGTGLGLSITKKVLEDHDGFITVRSSEGKGTAFTLYIPVK